MEQVTIMPDNPRMSLRDHKELIERVLGHEKAPRQRGSGKADMVPNFSIEAMGW